MANRFARAGGGNWTSNATWSTTSGGAADTVAPTAADDAILDAASGAVTIDAASVCRSLTCTGYTNTLTHNAFTLSIGDATAGAGNRALLLVSGMTYTLANAITSAISFISTSAAQQTIATGTKTLGSVTINGAGSSYQFSDNMTSSGSWTRTAGTIDLNSKVMTLNGAGPTFAGGGVSYVGTVSLTGSGATTITGANSFTTLTRTGTAVKGDSVIVSANQTVTGTCTLSGNSLTNRLYVTTDFIGQSRTITAAVVSLANVDIRDITGAGAGTWSGTSVGNAGGNSGITFTTPVTRWAIAAGNWSSTTIWSTTNGGGSGASVPLCHDTVNVNGNSGVGTIVADMPRMAADLSFTGYTGTLDMSSVSLIVYGSLTLATGMTIGASSLNLDFQGRGVHTISSAGKTFNHVAVRIHNAAGSYTLTDAFTHNGANGLQGWNTSLVTGGTFDTAGFNLTCVMYSSTGSFARTLTVTNSIITLTATSGTVWNITNTLLTFNVIGSAIIVAAASASARTFTGGGATYNDLRLAGGGAGAYTITGANTFRRLYTDGAGTAAIILPGSATTTLTSGDGLGNGTNVITFTASAGSATVSKAAGILSWNYVNLTNIPSTGGATFYAGANSTDGGGNTGWIFTNDPGPSGGYGLLTTQEYLNRKAGTVGLTKQQALQILAGPGAVGMTAQDAANSYAGTQGKDVQDALNTKAGTVGLSTQEAARRLP